MLYSPNPLSTLRQTGMYYSLCADVTVSIGDGGVVLAKAPWYDVSIKQNLFDPQFLSSGEGFKLLAFLLSEHPVVEIRACGAGKFSSKRKSYPNASNYVSSKGLLEDIYISSTYGTAISAVSAYTLIRSEIFRSLELRSRQQSQTIDIDLLEHLLQQSYFITSNAIDTLSAGLRHNSSPEFVRKLTSYINEERGHHIFPSMALKLMGLVTSLTNASFATTESMRLLKKAARQNRFAFAVSLLLFELSGYFKDDPLSIALRDLGFCDAARHTYKHFMLNKMSNHASIGMSLCEAIHVVTKSEVADAVELVWQLLDFLYPRQLV